MNAFPTLALYIASILTFVYTAIVAHRYTRAAKAHAGKAKEFAEFAHRCLHDITDAINEHNEDQKSFAVRMMRLQGQLHLAKETGDETLLKQTLRDLNELDAQMFSARLDREEKNRDRTIGIDNV